MEHHTLFESLRSYWTELYPAIPLNALREFTGELETLKKSVQFEPLEPQWYKDAVVYSLYVDLFNKDFAGLIEKLDYLKSLGVNCLWLLPILKSPMRDAGFDISDYRSIRPDLLGLPHSASDAERERVFIHFLQQAHENGIKVIFDIAINHTSEEHPWFMESRISSFGRYRDYYIWNSDDKKYSDARIIFKGLCASNWEKYGDAYYFHRFFEFQPDLNYHNPEVLLEMSKNLLFWLAKGVDGFRADAIPYIWKEEGTACENLHQAHVVVKFFRAVLDYVRPDTLLLAEACQKPNEVVKYFGNGDECHAGYHFPLMPQMFKALAMNDKSPVELTLSLDVTPGIPDNSQWFTFLRCHDELSLELVYVTEEDRKFIHDSYCRKPEWDFRLGQGISARLAELMDRDPRKIGLIFSVMLTLPGTPVVYYGDEFGKLNDEKYYSEMIRLTGKNDTRFLVRGMINWNELDEQLNLPGSYYASVYQQIKNQINIRRRFRCFGRGVIKWVNITDSTQKPTTAVLSFIRSYRSENIYVLNNLSPEHLTLKLPDDMDIAAPVDLLGARVDVDDQRNLYLLPYGYLWLTIRDNGKE
ncbi:MAG: alpha-amylase family glycosyl hydrolase [Bacteroidetes bacterium]|nr:alpha-amylase family glycosyl hydrolase [Bacteroidota bacterium]